MRRAASHAMSASWTSVGALPARKPARSRACPGFIASSSVDTRAASVIRPTSSATWSSSSDVHPPVVRGVRRAQHCPDALAKRLIVGLGLPYEVAQCPFADDRKQGGADGVVGMRERGLGEAKEDALLAAHSAQIAELLSLDTVLSPGADAMHQLDQQIDERVGDLGRA